MQRFSPVSSLVSRRCTRARLAPIACRGISTPVAPLPDFSFFPDFYTVDEQCTLLRAALRKLDSMESGRFRRRRKEFLRSPAARERSTTSPVQALFLPDELYDFQEACLAVL